MPVKKLKKKIRGGLKKKAKSTRDAIDRSLQKMSEGQVKKVVDKLVRSGIKGSDSLENNLRRIALGILEHARDVSKAVKKKTTQKKRKVSKTTTKKATSKRVKAKKKKGKKSSQKKSPQKKTRKKNA